MEKQEFLGIHEFYYVVSDYFDADLEDTEYFENETYYNHIHKEKAEHKEAIRLLSRTLEEETELSDAELETWHEDYEPGEWAGRYGRISEGGFKEDSPIDK